MNSYLFYSMFVMLILSTLYSEVCVAIELAAFRRAGMPISKRQLASSSLGSWASVYGWVFMALLSGVTPITAEHLWARYAWATLTVVSAIQFGMIRGWNAAYPILTKGWLTLPKPDHSSYGLVIASLLREETRLSQAVAKAYDIGFRSDTIKRRFTALYLTEIIPAYDDVQLKMGSKMLSDREVETFKMLNLKVLEMINESLNM